MFAWQPQTAAAPPPHKHMRNTRYKCATPQQAWAQDATQGAWTARFGSPEAAAAKIASDPALRLAPLHTHLGDLTGACTCTFTCLQEQYAIGVWACGLEGGCPLQRVAPLHVHLGVLTGACVC